MQTQTCKISQKAADQGQLVPTDTLQQLDQQTLADEPNIGWQPTVSQVFQGPNIHNIIINGFISRI